MKHMKRVISRKRIYMALMALIILVTALVMFLPHGRTVATNQADIATASDQLDGVWQYLQSGSVHKDTSFYSGTVARAGTARQAVKTSNDDLARSTLAKGQHELSLVRIDLTTADRQLGDLLAAAKSQDGPSLDTVTSDLSITLDVYNQHVMDYNDATYNSSGTRTALLYAGSFVVSSALAGGLLAWAFYRNQKDSEDVITELKRRLRWQAAYYALAATVVTLALAVIYFFTAIIPSPLFWIIPLGIYAGLLYTSARLYKVRRMSRRTPSKAA